MTEVRTRVWDPLVRLFHWSLVVLFTIAYFTGEEDSLLHIYSSYAIIGLLVLRIVWGLVGTRHARFSDFLYSPRRAWRYLRSLVSREPEHYTGHTPAGGWMIIALLISLALTSASGLKVYGLEGHGPLAAAGAGSGLALVAPAYADDNEDDEHEGREGHAGDGEEAEEFWEEIHEFFANFTVLLIFIHVAGVIVASAVHRENLVKAMITGDKTIDQP
jgi:cytochrome b